MYDILPYTKNRAATLGVTVRPSLSPGKKIDVFDDGKKVASIGSIFYSDYPHYLQDKGKAFADERKRLYHIRHRKDMDKEGTPSYYASRLLW